MHPQRYCCSPEWSDKGKLGLGFILMDGFAFDEMLFLWVFHQRSEAIVRYLAWKTV